MAGRPITQADIDVLDLSDAGDRALDLLAGGALTKTIAESVGVKAAALRLWLSRAERAAEVARARVSGAAALVEESVAIADGQKPLIHPETLEAVIEPSRDKLRIQTRQWIAERADRQTWGQQRETTVNIAVLHLDALRSRSVVHAEVIDDGGLDGGLEPRCIESS